ncbi:transcription initiation factor IIA subunit 1 [Selaginella moellendorffii]|uniref:transcription initiation factor IIA subunit 1 n=1 Tax=Selaginella moellendorffii TaxID=88036 RepID=UPI000D1C5476|nr:transcription initiation factor IIA subunit 1 [Selaginella moellendorffii]|eukprot:XP_024522180.1 transcription initiation factor IIA subunit 1 [Selaginella moellendorffii]
MATSVASVYLHVMEDVINNVRADFQAENVEESVLNDLQSLWELKMIQSGTISPGEIPQNLGVRNAAAQATSVQDLNIPYQGSEEFTPTAELLFSPYSTPTPGPDQTPIADKSGGDDSHNHRGVDVNVAYQEGQEDEENGSGQGPVTKDFFTLTSGKRKRDDLPANYFPGDYIPQHDGAADTPEETRRPSIPQHDGADDNYDDEVAQEDYNEPGDEEHPQPANETLVATATQVEGVESEGSEPPLNEQDDDEEDELNDIDQAGEEPKTSHLVLAQFEKVTRSKSKWKCILKDGIMHLNNRDILFVKANGEFDF